MHDIKERLSLFWLFALLNYLYADVIALWAIVGSRNPADTPHLSQLALLGAAVLMEIPIAMIVACRLLPFRANRPANIIAAGIVTLVNGSVTFVVPPILNDWPPAYQAYLFYGTIETVCTLVIIWQAWTWSGVEGTSEQAVHPFESWKSRWLDAARTKFATTRTRLLSPCAQFHRRSSRAPAA